MNIQKALKFLTIFLVFAIIFAYYLNGINQDVILMSMICTIGVIVLDMYSPSN